MSRMLCVAGSLLLAAGLFLPALPAVADEGLWLPEQLPQLAARLRSAGLELPPEKLAERLEAVIQLGGCSASFVSPEGLLLTNYHCAYSSIQQNSTVEKNLLDKGFLARKREEELPASPGALVYRMTGREDVTAQVTAGLAGITGTERFSRLDAAKTALVADCEKPAGTRCEVSSFYGGSQYWLYRHEEIRDVRLVYAPPLSIGQFGGDIDNFMWPRQTGDFAFFRAYVGPDGKPADPSPENRPYRPRQILKVATRPLADKDFVMVVGHPGQTERYRLAAEAQHDFEWKYPRQIAAFGKWMAVIEQTVRGDEEASLKYAGWLAGLNNTTKFARGMVDSYRSSGLLEAKQAQEKDLAAWIAEDKERQAKYGAALEALRRELASGNEQRELEMRYHMATRTPLLNAARELYRLAREQRKPDAEREEGYRDRDREDIRRNLQRLDSRFDQRVDRAVWRSFLLEYQELPAGQRRPDFDAFFGLAPDQSAADSQQAIDRALDRLYSATRLTDPQQRLELMKATAAEIEASADPFLALAHQLDAGDAAARAREERRAGSLQALRSEYMVILMAYMASRGQLLYPDANTTRRISYGALSGNTSADGRTHPSFTAAEDLLARTTGEKPFDTPAEVVRLLKEKHFGTYRDPSLGSLPINFMATADVTGGSSGSPTLDRRGELTGLLFDTNYESAISKWRYVPAFSRSVHLDIRYILWILDQVEHAGNLLGELGLPATAETPAGVKP